MTVKECYAAFGGDFEGTLARLSSEKLVDRFIRKFLADESFATLKKALEEENYEEAFRAAHTLKGVGMNLGITKLYQISGELTEEMRGGKKPENESLITQLEAEYEHTRAVISEFAGA
ncbi:MAG: Hpt domain-containing protein [Acetatifactor sp.]|nr:Hpt domain-containing protein [Acetatifactor sp.]MDE7353957.1 Hpt domain-containing protein [Acetatifactor sp.]